MLDFLYENPSDGDFAVWQDFLVTLIHARKQAAAVTFESKSVVLEMLDDQIVHAKEVIADYGRVAA